MGFKKPDLLILGYPCCETDPNKGYPSLIYSFVEPIMSIQFLTFCIQSVASPNELNYWLLNPMNIPKSILKEFPKTEFQIGSFDPLRDH